MQKLVDIGYFVLNVFVIWCNFTFLYGSHSLNTPKQDTIQQTSPRLISLLIVIFHAKGILKLTATFQLMFLSKIFLGFHMVGFWIMEYWKSKWYIRFFVSYQKNNKNDNVWTLLFITQSSIPGDKDPMANFIKAVLPYIRLERRFCTFAGKEQDLESHINGITCLA